MALHLISAEEGDTPAEVSWSARSLEGGADLTGTVTSSTGTWQGLVCTAPFAQGFWLLCYLGESGPQHEYELCRLTLPGGTLASCGAFTFDESPSSGFAPNCSSSLDGTKVAVVRGESYSPAATHFWLSVDGGATFAPKVFPEDIYDDGAIPTAVGFAGSYLVAHSGTTPSYGTELRATGYSANDGTTWSQADPDFERFVVGNADRTPSNEEALYGVRMSDKVFVRLALDTGTFSVLGGVAAEYDTQRFVSQVVGASVVGYSSTADFLTSAGVTALPTSTQRVISNLSGTPYAYSVAGATDIVVNLNGSLAGLPAGYSGQAVIDGAPVPLFWTGHRGTYEIP